MEGIVLKPLFSYIGSKYGYYIKLKDYLPNCIDNYYEPFCGGCGFALELSNNCVVYPHNINLNDLSGDIIDLYNTVKDDVDALIGGVTKYPRSIKTFDELKDKYNNNTLNSEEKSTVFLYLLSYKSPFCRSMDGGINSKSRDFYLTKGRKLPKSSLFNKTWEQNAFNLSLFFREASLSNLNYVDFVEKCQEGDFVFFDPPYLNGIKYLDGYDFDFNVLKIILDKLTEKRVMFMLILGDHSKLRRIFGHYPMFEIQKQHNIFGNVKEIIFYNYEKNGLVFEKDTLIEKRFQNLKQDRDVGDTIDLELGMDILKLEEKEEKKLELNKCLKYRSFWIIITTVLITTEIYNLINFMINWVRIGNDLWYYQPEWPVGTAILLILCMVSTYTVFYFQNKIIYIRNK